MLTTQLIERAAAENLLQYARAMGGETLPCAGGVAARTGLGSPLTTVKGAWPVVTERDIDAAEAFFGANPVTFELAPEVDASALVHLGYEPVGNESVAARPAPDEVEVVPEMVLLLDDDTWAGLFAKLADWLPPGLPRAASRLPGAVNLAIGGEACAQLAPAGGIAIFGNDNTHPSARGRGHQQTLIRARLQYARDQRLPYCIAEVAPGSISERNYLRCGFTIAYVRTYYSKHVNQPAAV